MTPLEEATAALDSAQAEHRKHEDAYAALVTYEAALKALGTEPTLPIAKPSPTPPETKRPTDADVSAAQATLRRRDEAVGARKRAAEEADRAKAEHAKAATALADAETEATRTTALLSAARAAPSDLFREQVAALGDMGPFALHAPERESDRDRHIIATMDGFPIEDASDGRRVLASLLLQAAVRRAATERVDKSFRFVPIVTDNAQALSAGAGPWPENIDGPVWWCVTTKPGTVLMVSAGRPA